VTRLVIGPATPDSQRVIPVSIVTGFLGSGKTTLIARCLRDPRFARTAVIVNEFGEVGLDHELIASSDETLLTLTTGCLCCAVRSDLVETLLGLLARRQDGTAVYDRVLIETSGLADPAPILHALMTDQTVTAGHTIDTVVTVIDAIVGPATLDRHPEARRQVAVADRLALSKTDAAGLVPALRHRLTAMNPGAPLALVGEIGPWDLFPGAGPGARANLPRQPARSPFDQAHHSDGIETFVLRHEAPLPALALTLLLQALAEHCGARLLRVKGLVALAELPDGPAVIHGVQHVFAAPEFLGRWPSDDHSTRIVFITSGVPRHFPARLLAAIEEEVLEEVALNIPSQHPPGA
jgi:G3E family GTPase